MKTKLLFFFLTSLLTFSLLSLSQAQDNTVIPQRWNIDVRSLPPIDNNSTLQYTPLPVEETVIEQPPTVRYEYTPNGIFAISSSSRILPRTSSQSEVMITRHPLNPYLLFASANTYPVYGGLISEGVYVTTNGGATWFGKDSCTGAPTNTHVGDPGPIIDKNGTFIMTHLRYNYGTGQLTGMDANYSNDNGATWSNSVTLLAGSQDKNLATSDDSPTSAFYGRSYCVWSRFTAASPPIAISYTANGGVSWSAAADINVSAGGHYSQGCDVRTGPNGEVYVCWANPGAGLIEDFCGFAKSVNGGVTWTINSNNVFDMNGIRGTLPTVNNIRVNSFPRIDVDRTCGPRAGWIYIVVSQKNLAPAGSDPDIILHRSSDGGTTWSAGIRVNQDALNNGKIQYFPCVRVDESGAVNIFYYDNRNTAAPVMQNYLSRSTDGGVTFTDVKITDHNFTPNSIPGLAGGYQGDYIGVTSGAGGKIFCNWMDNSSGTYQSWIANVDVTKPNICEDFSCANFNPTSNFYEELFTGTNYWSRNAVSAYGIGAGSAKFDFATANVGVVQSLVSYEFPPAAVGTHLSFDLAYAAWSAAFGPDTLLIQTSLNGGVSYSTLITLLGKADGTGELNTAPTQASPFTPTPVQWRSRIFALPVGTNKIRLRAKSGFGNNLYLDNICIITGDAAVSSIGVVPEAMYIPAFPFITYNDTIKVYLCRTDFPSINVDSAKCIIQDNANAPFTMSRALTGTYYIKVNHRNTIETWSKAGGELYTRGSSFFHNFIQPAGQAYGNNQKLVSASFGHYGMFSGDVDQDFAIDLGDLSLIDNAAFAFTTGYVPEDLNGDFLVDLSDYTFADNNAFNFVTRAAPPGAEPEPAPAFEYDSKALTFENEALRQKYELSMRLMKETKPQDIQTPKKKEISKELLEIWKNRLKNKPSDRQIEKGNINNNMLDQTPNSSRVGEPQ
ncbi:MAG: glycoside hydrolase [Bacteroidota bacterium]|nr:glycoside hydrolase [Bacteroidota bacterium]